MFDWIVAVIARLGYVGVALLGVIPGIALALGVGKVLVDRGRVVAVDAVLARAVMLEADPTHAVGEGEGERPSEGLFRLPHPSLRRRPR